MSRSKWHDLVWRFVLVGFCLAFIAAFSVSAQLPTGTILGVVKDTTGGTVAGANVTVTNVDTGATRAGQTGDDGAYRFPALPTGNYSVSFMKDGFQTVDRKGITLVVGQEAAIDATLPVGSTGQTVTVTEEAPQVNTTGSSLGGTVDEQKVEDLPLNGRNYVDLTIMQAGVTQTAITTGPYGMNGTMFSSNGATLRSNTTLLDGAPTVTLMGVSAGSIIGTSLGVDGIKEYKVVTVLPSAEYGQTMGSQSTIVSKGGANQFHGDVFEYLRNSALDARNFFDSVDGTNSLNLPCNTGDNKLLAFPCKRIPPFNRNNFGGSFGGPIRKDKTFFYGVYEGLRESFSPSTFATSFNLGCYYDQNNVLHSTIPAMINNDPTTNPATVAGVACIKTANVGNPTGGAGLYQNKIINVGCPWTNITGTAGPNPVTNGGCSTTPSPLILQLASIFPQPNVKGESGFNFTWPFKQPSKENYEQLRLDQTFSGTDSGFFRYTVDTVDQHTAGNYPAFVNWNRSASYIGTASETHIISSALLNSVRFSYSRTGLNLAAPTVPLLTAGVLVPGLDASTSIGPGSGVTAMGTVSGNTQGDIFQNVYSIGDDVFFTKGKHAFKFGTNINHYTGLYRVNIFDRGAVAFSSNTDFFTGNWNSVSGRAADGNNDRLYNWNTLGFYAQDDFHILPRVTLNLGLRYEFQTTITAPPGLTYTVFNVRTSSSSSPGALYLNNSLHDFSPRFGFAWDVFGNGKMSLRGGAGIFYDVANPGSEIAGNGSGDPFLAKQIKITSTGNTPGVTVNGVFNPIPLTASPNCFTPMCAVNQTYVQTTARVADYHMAQPSLGQWNLAIDRQLPLGMALSVAYVGTKGWHIKQTTEGNPTTPLGYQADGLPFYCAITNQATGACGNSNFNTRTNTVFRDALGHQLNQVQYYTAGGDTYYHGLQTSLNMRSFHGAQFQLNYTYARNIDDGQKVNSDSGSGPVSGQTVDQLWDDKGLSFVDVRHNIRGNLIYHAPSFKSDKLWAAPLHGWWFGSIVSYQTGFPINPILGTDRSLQNNGNVSTRPNLDPSYNAATVITGNPSMWFNPSMFDVQPAGTLGNAGRNILRGPKLVDMDLSVNKDTRVKWLGEQGAVQFRLETFNLFNHANFLAPSGTLWNSPGTATIGTVASGQLSPTSTTLGYAKNVAAVTATTNKSRQIQVALKVVF